MPPMRSTGPDLGHLTEGAVGDITVLEIQKGKFGFVDSGDNRLWVTGAFAACSLFAAAK